MITQTQILSHLNCARHTWLKKHKKELANDLNEGDGVGRHFIDEAYDLLGKGIFAGENWDQALINTAAAHKSELSSPLFRGAYKAQELTVRVDAVMPNNNGLTLVRICPHASVKERSLIECAIQYWVMREAGYVVDQVVVIHINSAFEFTGHINKNFLSQIDVTKTVQDLASKVPSWHQDTKQTLGGDLPKMDACCTRKQGDSCSFGHVCMEERDEFPLSILPGGGKIVKAMVEAGVNDVRHIPDGMLKSERQQRVRRVTISGKPELDDKAKQILQQLSWPRFYLDFESIQMAIPVWIGTKPYQQIPFQWSCHIENLNGEITHGEFLAASSADPRYEFIETLLALLGDTGPIMVFSHFEKERLNDLAITFPELSARITGIIDRLVDLLPLTRESYYHPDMKGSWSVKEVLPTITSDSGYKQMQLVSNGKEAQQRFAEYVFQCNDEDRRVELRTALLDYCGLDSKALYDIAKFLLTAH